MKTIKHLLEGFLNKSTYAALQVDAASRERIIRAIHSHNRSEMLMLDDSIQIDLHCTLVYSKNSESRLDFDGKRPEDFPKLEGRERPELSFTAVIDHVEWWAGHDREGYLVAVLRNAETAYHFHNQLVTFGAKHSFTDYTPHVTLITGKEFNAEEISEYSKVLSGMMIKFDHIRQTQVKD